MKPDVRAQILDLAATYPTPRAAVLSALQMVQEAEGGRLSADDLTEVRSCRRAAGNGARHRQLLRC